MTDPVAPPKPEPVFNLPPVIIGWLGLLIAIHAGRAWMMSQPADDNLLLTFSFIPLRYDAIGLGLPGGEGARFWSPVTFSMLHASWMHLIVNCFWLAAFGTVVARRLGSVRFTAFSLLASVAAAGAHYLSGPHDPSPVIGVSGALSAHMAAAVRFMFSDDPRGAGLAGTRPGLTLAGVFSNSRALAFIGFWLVTNYLFGVGATLGGEDARIAWQAHLGGFLFGLAAFSLFEPRTRAD